jgi:8-oxo-dGTP diphosphatase
MGQAVVRAAGGVVLRQRDKGYEVVVVYRLRYGDWTLPKGKCEQGEADEDCALREVWEETGLRCEALDEGPSTTYVDRRDRPKQVRYWAMRVTEGEVRPAPPEVDEVRWMPVAEAGRLLTHAHDRRVVEAVVAGRDQGGPAGGGGLAGRGGRQASA